MRVPDSKAEPATDRTRRLHETTIEIEVPLYHVDSLEIVWHGRYCKYLKQARIALLRLGGRELTLHGFDMRISTPEAILARPASPSS